MSEKLFMKNIPLNTSNPDHLTYDHPPLDLEILGGIRLEGLDRMRVTLKIMSRDEDPPSGPAVRHNLDLYNDIQTEKLIRKIAERLEVGTSIAWEALNQLTDCLEQYRLDHGVPQESKSRTDR